jgi:hypothetical protein
MEREWSAALRSVGHRSPPREDRVKHAKLLVKSTVVAILLLGVATSTPAALTPSAVVFADFSGGTDDLDAG